MLARKHDWHDIAGIKYLLEHGADPNRITRWGRTALLQAILRDNSIDIVEALLDHGAGSTSAPAMAARRGRADLLDLFEKRGMHINLQGVERLLAACARDQPSQDPEPLSEAGKPLAEFAGNGNTNGVRRLLDLGVDVNAPFKEGDGYWDVTTNSIALHVAAWRGRHATVKLLLERGAHVNAEDAKGRTPLALAVKACVDSYWTDRRSPESVQALLNAGASTTGLTIPSGYAEVDELLAP